MSFQKIGKFLKYLPEFMFLFLQNFTFLVCELENFVVLLGQLSDDVSH